MYASVSRVDLVASNDVGLILVYTDHRAPAEIAAEPELSVLLAIARLCAGRHHFETNEGKVVAEIVYATLEPPPDFLREAVTLAGGVVELPSRERLPAVHRERTIDEVIARSFADLASRVLRRLGERDLRRALSIGEQVARLTPMTEDDDPVAYWTSVMELAALAGLALAETVPGTWRMATMQVPPFAFEPEGDSGRMALPCNRAQRFVERGLPADSLLGLLDAFAEVSAEADGPRLIMPSLRAASERGLGLGLRPLIDDRVTSDVDVDVELPVVAFGRDGEHTFALIMGEEFARDGDTLVEQALRNICDVEPQIDRHQVAGIELLAVSGHYFAAEKLLDRGFMRRLGVMLGTGLVAAAVPRRGLLLAVDARPDSGDEVQALTVLYLSAVEEHRDAGSRAICTTPLLVADGRIVGAAQVDEDAAKQAHGEGELDDEDVADGEAADDAEDTDSDDERSEPN